MVTIILHYPHCGSQARVTPRAFPQWQTEGSLSCLQPPQPRESDSHCLSRSAPRGDRECLPRTRASCAASPVRSGSLGPPEPGGSKKRSATSSLTDTTAGSGSPRVHFHGAGAGRTVVVCAQKSQRLLDLDCLVPKEPSSRGVCRWGSQPARRASACGMPLQRRIARARRDFLNVSASVIARSSRQPWANRREKPPMSSAGITRYANAWPVLCV